MICVFERSKKSDVCRTVTQSTWEGRHASVEGWNGKDPSRNWHCSWIRWICCSLPLSVKPTCWPLGLPSGWQGSTFSGKISKQLMPAIEPRFLSPGLKNRRTTILSPNATTADFSKQQPGCRRSHSLQAECQGTNTSNAGTRAFARGMKITFFDLINVCMKKGCGGGASGWAVAFCPSRLGSNPGTDKAISVQNYCESILAGHWAFSKEWERERCMLFHLLSCFLLPLSKFVNCDINNERRKNKKFKNRPGKAHI